MPKAIKTETGQAEPIVLKHRVAGAATLLFFGALVLPWVLGPPSDAVNPQSILEQDAPIVDVSSSEIEDELLNEIAESEPVKEEVYISKITPFDSDSGDQNTSDNSASESAQTVEPKTQIATTQIGTTQASSTEERLKSEQGAERKAQQELIAQREAKARTEIEAKKRQAEVVAQKQSKIEAELAAALTAEASEQTLLGSSASGSDGSSNKSPIAKVERGYVVQVGVYVNKLGADRVVKDLRSKGFSPSTTVVDTNRGKKTATRVWLGPFAQRVDAGKAKSRFAELTGQGSLIREYP